jgi:large subunit ribosomal protein L10
MAKTKQQKEQEVKDLTDKLATAKAVVFASYKSLTVSQTENLRKALRQEGAELKMAKKNLLRIALQNNKLDQNLVDNFTGSVTVAFGYDDEVIPAKVVAKFGKANDTLQIFGGILEKSFIDTGRVQALATLPAREELLAKLVGSINAPVSGFVNVLAGNLRSLVYVLDAIKTIKN